MIERGSGLGRDSRAKVCPTNERLEDCNTDRTIYENYGPFNGDRVSTSYDVRYVRIKR